MKIEIKNPNDLYDLKTAVNAIIRLAEQLEDTGETGSKDLGITVGNIELKVFIKNIESVSIKDL